MLPFRPFVCNLTTLKKRNCDQRMWKRCGKTELLKSYGRFSFPSLLKKNINPLGPKSDQHQFSPNNINTQSKEKVMRIDEIIT